ncbi:MAG TPA: DegT/DnrJ/EryC1/StrS family aminotransferase [Myxococcota bacterium]|nr:DegT/DnrJ/EryC1/StrS family aminotransferase [Myxococcota bacterium]
MGRNGPRILVIGGTYRAVSVLERLLERGERVVAFIGVEGGGERDFCPEILELCDRAGIPARSGHKLGEEVVRWLEDRIRPELAIALGVHTEIPLSIGGNCRLGLVELSDSLAGGKPAVCLRQRGQELLRRQLPPQTAELDPGDLYLAMLEELSLCLEEFLDRHAQPRVERAFAIPFEAPAEAGAGLAALSVRGPAGSACDALERRAAEYLGAERVFALETPRAGFRALLRGVRLDKGDEVVVPGVASAALVDALRACELQPVYADVHPERLTLAAASAAAAIGPRTRGLLISHPLGQPAELDALYALAEERRLEVIEDGCESLGARFGSSRLGRSPCSAVFRVPLGCHAPGFELALVTAPESLAKDLESAVASERAPDGLARLGLEALERWEDRLAARRRSASAYSSEFSRYDAFRVPPTPEDALSTYSGYLLRLTRFARAAADDLGKLLAEAGIETRRLRLPLGERELASLPAAEHARATGLLLPADESLTDSQRDRVMDEIFGYAIG